jgi:hypothetical protein
MNQKHFASALIFLLLPLSFGVGKTDATKTEGTTGASDPIQFQIDTLHGFTAADISRRQSVFTTDVADDSGLPITTFVSSFDASVTRIDGRCERPINRNKNPGVNRLNGDCLSAGGAQGTMGFPMYDSFSGSDRSQYSRTVGALGGIGPGLGAGGGSIGPGSGTVTNPVVNPAIVTPEPGTILLLAIGLLSLAAVAGRRARRVTA